MEAYNLGGAGARQIDWSVFFSQVSSQFGSSGLSASLIAKYFWICGTKTERRKHLQSLFIRWAHRSSWIKLTALRNDVTGSRQGDDGSTNYSNAVGFCDARAAWLPWPPMLLPGVRCLKTCMNAVFWCFLCCLFFVFWCFLSFSRSAFSISCSLCLLYNPSQCPGV